MQSIVATIKPGESGPHVRNLQDALLLLIERLIIRSFDPPNHPTMEELQTLTASLKDERAAPSSFGEATTALVRYFQIQQNLGDNLYGIVEEMTAAKLGKILELLGVFDVGFIVRGVVGTSNGQPLAGIIIRAFDRDLRREEFLGEARTDATGKYEIRFAKESFACAEKGGPDLIVRAFDVSGKRLAESPLVRRKGKRAVVNLTVPISEWITISEAVTPLLANQGAEGKPLQPWELNDQDLEFIVDEATLEREQLRLWVLAIKNAHDADLLGAAATNMEMFEAMAFFGWYRNGMPLVVSELLSVPSNDLIDSFLRACDTDIIPARCKDYEQELVQWLARLQS